MSVERRGERRIAGRSQIVIDDQHPWPGLSAFDEGSERFFNGRTAESAELRRIVLQAPLSVLFGVSGLGKSSLLQAGVFPLLRQDNMLPVLIRLDFNDRSAPLIEQARAALEREIEGRRVEAPAFAKGESLWEYLHRADLELWSPQNQLLTPVFVFDQFEEVFTLGADEKMAVKQLKNDLANLVENRLPDSLAARTESEEDARRCALDSQRYRFLLSLREDFLPAMEGWKREMPSILKNRLRLLPMNGKQALRAIHDTAPNLTTDALAGRIMVFVAKAQASDDVSTSASSVDQELSVEPSLLSLVCHGLNEKRLAAHKEAIDEALLEETGPSIVSDFYRGAVGDLRGRVRKFIETELITERGFRKPCDEDDARQKYDLTQREIDLLVERRLVRLERVRDTNRVELTHDLLTSVVRQHRDRERERLRRRRRERILMTAGAVFIATVGGAGVMHERADTAARRTEASKDSAQLQETARVIKDESQARENAALHDLTDQLTEANRLASAQEAAAMKNADGLKKSFIEQRGAQVARASRANFAAVVARHRLGLDQHATDAFAVAFSDSLARSSHEFDSVSTLVRGSDLRALHGVAVAAALYSNADTIPFDAYSHLDLFDLRGTSPRITLTDASSFARPLFGDSTDNREARLQPAFFDLASSRDSGVVEWTTPRAIVLRSIALFARHDGVDGAAPLNNSPRALSVARLDVMARRPGMTDTSWRTVAAYSPPVPYGGSDSWGDDQPGRSLSMCVPVRYIGNDSLVAVNGSHFRLTVGRPAPSAEGPRIVELDGYAEASCGFPPRAVDELFTSATTFARRYARSTLAIATVLALLDTNRVYPASGGGADTLASALRFLARAADAAWNQQLVRRAAYLLRRNPHAPDGEALWPLLRRIVREVDALVAIDFAADTAATLLQLAKSDTLPDEQLLDKLESFARTHRPNDAAPRAAIRLLTAKVDSVRQLVAFRRAALATLADSTTSVDLRDRSLRTYRDRLETVRGGHSAYRSWAVAQHSVVKRGLADRFRELLARAKAIVDDSTHSLAEKVAVLDSASRMRGIDPGGDLWVADLLDRFSAKNGVVTLAGGARRVTGDDVMRVVASNGPQTFAFEHDTGSRWIMRGAGGQEISYLQEYQREPGNVFLNDVCVPNTYWQLSTALRQINHFSNRGGGPLAAWYMTSADRTQAKPASPAVVSDTTRPANGLDVNHIRATAGKTELAFDLDCPKRWTVKTADGKTSAQLEEYQRYEGTIFLNDLGAPGTFWEFNTAQRSITRVSGATGKVLVTYRIVRAVR